MKTISSRPGLRYLLIAISLSYAVGIPPPLDPPSFSAGCVNGDSDRCYEAQHRAKRATGDNAGFKYFYVTQCDIFNAEPSGVPFIEVAATNKTQDDAHYRAAKTIYLMLRFMPASFFSRMAKKACVGIFAVDEVVGDYPEYAYTKDTEKCKNKCNGNCSPTCTPDGRKFDRLSGYSKQRAVVREDNVVCADSDPYNGRLNVLMHEFAHNIHLYGLGTDFRRHKLLDKSFSNRYNVWGRGYATSDQKEYFAEATTSYFRTSLLEAQSAGMNKCRTEDTLHFCKDEFSSRENLKKDQDLYKLVDDIYSGERSFLEGRIGVCN